ncbi:hypothetical protein HAX54_038450 [Datura stramonium]|uniref:Uncharacterized protein n=1 Tax=Datura stramonium TaxID=4076 RepID=A0ABS8VJS6_DATST|nr:hypothetical protein [Datura stramonium]
MESSTGDHPNLATDVAVAIPGSSSVVLGIDYNHPLFLHPSNIVAYKSSPFNLQLEVGRSITGILGANPAVALGNYEAAMFTISINQNQRFKKNYNLQCEVWKCKGHTKETDSEWWDFLLISRRKSLVLLQLIMCSLRLIIPSPHDMDKKLESQLSLLKYHKMEKFKLDNALKLHQIYLLRIRMNKSYAAEQGTNILFQHNR